MAFHPTPEGAATGTPAIDLSDAECGALADMLAATPEPLEPLDVVMLDGFLCGVLVQPVALAPAAWLPHVFDAEGRPLPDDVDAQWQARTAALILRRHAALNRSLFQDGRFDPLILEFDDAHPIAVSEYEAGAGLSPASQALMPWVAGFQFAIACFPDLVELEDDTVFGLLTRLYRHLPVQDEREREVVATLDRENPLAGLDEAIDELVVTVADLADLTRERRYKVETVRRAVPKVGRNEPCPCGSGKKFKQCHGA